MTTVIYFSSCRPGKYATSPLRFGRILMQRFREMSRVIFVLVLLPLTLFNGRASAGCICADGHFELMCRGGSCCTRSEMPRQTESCGCSKCCYQAKAAAKKSCCQRQTLPKGGVVGSDPSSEKSGGCCHPLMPLPMVTHKATVPQSDHVSLAIAPTVSTIWLAPVIGPSFPVHEVDSGPPRMRLQILQRLLI